MSCARPGLTVSAPRALLPRRCRARLPALDTCLSREPDFVLGGKVSLLCAQGVYFPFVVRQSCVLLHATHLALSWARELPVMASLVQVCRDIISPAARATLSCAPKASRARLAYSVVCAWPLLCRGQLCRDPKILCRDKNFPYHG